MSSRYINKALIAEQNNKLEYVKFINEANMLGSDLQGVVQLTDASGTFPTINQWTSGAGMSSEVKLAGSWKANIKFILPVFLQEFWVFTTQTINRQVDFDKIVFKRKTIAGKWHVTSTRGKGTQSSDPQLPSHDEYWHCSNVFRIRQNDLESIDDQRGSTEWQIDFENYKDNCTTSNKAGFRVQYADW